MLNRRELLKQSGLAALLLGTSRLSFAAEPEKKKLLMYTRSEGFEHSVVKRNGGKPALAEQIFTDLAKKQNIEVVCEKDGRVFLSKEFPSFDGFFFQTQGNLAKEQSKDGQPPVPPEGKKALLEAIAAGKPFLGCHCASDTYHSTGAQFENQDPSKRDPYIAMIGGEFIRHGAQQKGWMRVADEKFPAVKDVKDYEMMEEWYSLKNFAPDLHVILIQDTKGMKGFDYERPNFPATWARMHEKGRVFFTSMGHREDVWQSEIFAKVMTGALAWALGRIDADITPNMAKVTPEGSVLPKMK
jgi:type 1 glutamine amidotransferase